MSTVKGLRIPLQEKPVNLIELAQRTAPPSARKEAGESSFKDMFSRQLAEAHGLTVSRHAHERMYSRGIELSDEKLARVAEAVDKAHAKGSKETLILTDDAAFVVSVPNRTIITAFEREHLRQGVVTSIDSAVIV